MRDSLRNFLYGVGRIFCLMPNTDYSVFISRKSTEDRIRESFESVGNSISAAIIQHEQTKEH